MKRYTDAERINWLFPKGEIKKQGDRWWAVCDILDTPANPEPREAIDAAIAASKRGRGTKRG